MSSVPPKNEIVSDCLMCGSAHRQANQPNPQCIAHGPARNMESHRYTDASVSDETDRFEIDFDSSDASERLVIWCKKTNTKVDLRLQPEQVIDLAVMLLGRTANSGFKQDRLTDLLRDYGYSCKDLALQKAALEKRLTEILLAVHHV